MQSLKVKLYALRFCQSKEITTDGMSISMDLEKDSESGLINKINLELKLPEGFPEKYRKAIINSMELCTVKKHLITPPEIEIKATE